MSPAPNAKHVRRSHLLTVHGLTNQTYYSTSCTVYGGAAPVGTTLNSQSTASVGLFQAYEEPNDPSCTFSARRIASLTIEGAMRLSIPKICDRNTLEFLDWSVEVPTTELLTLIDPSGYIPHIDDFRSMLCEFIIKFHAGMRSVRVRVRGMVHLCTCNTAD